MTRAQRHDSGDPLDLHHLLALAERAARRAGDLVRDRRPDSLAQETKSSPTDVVTEMDTAAEALLREDLLGARPDDGLLGEEGGLLRGTSGVTWVVDPIDGTTNYLYRIPSYAVSVAAVLSDPDHPEALDAVVGVVHNPATGETWTAVRGGGAHLDERPLRVAEPPPLERALVGTGFGYAAERRRSQAAVLADLLPRVRDVRRAGSAALDLCAVASGRLDVYYERGLHPWDLAAGALVVKEAGGDVRGLHGRPAGEALTVAGGRPLLDALVAELERLRADEDVVGPEA